MDSFLKRVFIRAGKHRTVHVVHPHHVISAPSETYTHMEESERWYQEPD